MITSSGITPLDGHQSDRGHAVKPIIDAASDEVEGDDHREITYWEYTCLDFSDEELEEIHGIKTPIHHWETDPPA